MKVVKLFNGQGIISLVCFGYLINCAYLKMLLFDIGM